MDLQGSVGVDKSETSAYECTEVTYYQLSTSFLTLQSGFLHIAWRSGLGLNNLKLHKTKAVKNICFQEKFVIQLIFNLGLGSTRACLHVNLTRPCNPIQNQPAVVLPMTYARAHAKSKNNE